jgi:hypothetical protein
LGDPIATRAQEGGRGVKFILIPIIMEAIAIVVVPAYWLIKLGITFTYGVLALTILALMIFLAITPSWHGAAILREFVGIFAVARAIDLVVRGAAKVGVHKAFVRASAPELIGVD